MAGTPTTRLYKKGHGRSGKSNINGNEDDRYLPYKITFIAQLSKKKYIYIRHIEQSNEEEQFFFIFAYL